MIEAGAFDPRCTGRIELIRGRLLSMAITEWPPQYAMDILLNCWAMRLPIPPNVWIQVKGPIALPLQQSRPEPDMAFIAKPVGSKTYAGADDVFLLIEIAESSLRFDRGEKADLYAAAGIKDYWIVNLVDQCIEVRREPRAGKYQSVESCASGAEVRPLAFPEIALPVKLLFAET